MENSNWKEVQLSNICDIISTKTSIENATLENYISTENMINDFGGVQNAEKLPTTNTVNAFVENDILFSNIRTYFKKVWHAKFDGTVSQDVLTFRAKENIISKFLYYTLCNPEFTEYTVLTSKGAKMPRGDKDAIRNFEIQLPPLPEQKAIASVLSSLDDKIDLLHQQNQTLEALAETLFRQWFIEEAKEDWERVKLSKVVDIAIGRTPPRKESHWFSTNGNDIKWISIKDLGNDGVFISNTSEYLTKKAVEKFRIPVIPKGTVVLSFKMTVGRVAITSYEMLSNEAIAHFKFNNDTPFTTEYLYLFLKLFKYDTLGSTSSIVTAINSAMIKDIEISIPDTLSMKKFEESSCNLFDKILENQKQVQTLTKLRDTLLPKLMSGEVRVKI